MSSLINTWRFQLGGMLVIAAAVAAAFWIGEGAKAGLLAGAWMLAFVALVHFGRNKVDALNAIGGVGDERTRSLYTSAIAFAGNVTAFVIVGCGSRPWSTATRTRPCRCWARCSASRASAPPSSSRGAASS
jgi:hypothetical protein